MAGLGIEDLGKPPKRYRPSRVSASFETETAAAKEDKWRLKRLKKWLKHLDQLGFRLSKTELRKLISDIRGGLTPASSAYMRKLRNRIAGHLWVAIESNIADASTFTLVPRSGRISGGTLERADAVAFIESLRSAFIRAGFNGENGWLILFIHGEHEPTADEFVLHGHGLAVGSARAAVDRLRRQREFRSIKGEAQKNRVPRRVRMSRAPLKDLPDPLTYIVQSFWPERPAFENSQGVSKRQRRKRRIEEPRHTEVLAWLNRWPLADTCLLMGTRVTRSGFRRTCKKYTNGGQS